MELGVCGRWISIEPCGSEMLRWHKNGALALMGIRIMRQAPSRDVVIRWLACGGSARTLNLKSRKPKGIIAFTLVELLVVIAIIAILSAILLPSLVGARDMAKRIKCLSNQKSMGQIHAFYSADYNEYTIPAWRCSANGGIGAWYNYTSLYYDALSQKPGTIYFCPSAKIVWICVGNSFASYSWNCDFGYLDGAPGCRAPKLMEIESPTNCCFMTDISTYSSYDSSYQGGWYLIAGDLGEVIYGFSNYHMPDYHSQGNDLVYVDGHAANQKTGNLASQFRITSALQCIVFP